MLLSEPKYYFMYSVGKIKNKQVILFFSFVLITGIGVIDYITAAELTLSIFYLIPVSAHALYQDTSRKGIIINTFFAAFVWIAVIYKTNYYSSNFYLFWNAFVIFLIFLIVGLLLHALKIRYKKINEMNEYLRQLNDEKNKFIGIAALDIRSPVSAINAFSDLLISEHAKHMNPETERIISYIKDLSENSLVFLGNLLNISAIESGKINLKKTNQDYLVFVKQNVYLNQILADKKGIRINLECTNKFIRFGFDEHYMQEVLNNLLSNAIKFSFPNSKILVRISRTDNNMVKTEIIDTGIGIPDSEQSNLFKYFQTASSRPTAGEKSTGLGLAIIKKIIDEHQGTVNFESSASGSNFYFILPG